MLIANLFPAQIRVGDEIVSIDWIDTPFGKHRAFTVRRVVI